jgi:hypothetical protein
VNQNEIPIMTMAYIECALFTADEEVIAPTSGEFDIATYRSRITKAMLWEACQVCSQFYHRNANDLQDWSAISAGHDLWYTRNHHGTGFWDRDNGTDDSRERLTDNAHALRSRSVYRNRGWFHFDIA